MPDRIIRERATRSPTLRALTDAAERAWWRLTVAADDYGRFDADAEVCLARLFQRRPSGWTLTKMRRVLEEWLEAGLVAYYEVGIRRYGQIINWSLYQRPPRLASKFPDPPGELTVPEEHTVHSALVAALKASGEFCGHPILSLDRNVRIGNGFADLVLTIPAGRLVVEVKRTRADAGAIRQVVGYGERLQGCAGKVILATGIGPTVGPADFEKAGVALITYSPGGTTSVVVKTALIATCSTVISQDFSGGSHLADLAEKRETRSERREARDEKREEIPPPPLFGGAAEAASDNGWGAPEHLVALYNTLTPDECPAVTKLSPARKQKARVYLKTFPDKDFWHRTFQQIGKSRFLRGLEHSADRKPFVADFDWLLTKGKDGTENAVKVAEGKYQDKVAPHGDG